MLQNFARCVGQFEIQNPIILDSFKFSVPLVSLNVHLYLHLYVCLYMRQCHIKNSICDGGGLGQLRAVSKRPYYQVRAGPNINMCRQAHINAET